MGGILAAGLAAMQRMLSPGKQAPAADMEEDARSAAASEGSQNHDGSPEGKRPCISSHGGEAARMLRRRPCSDPGGSSSFARAQAQLANTSSEHDRSISDSGAAAAAAGAAPAAPEQPAPASFSATWRGGDTFTGGPELLWHAMLEQGMSKGEVFHGKEGLSSLSMCPEQALDTIGSISHMLQCDVTHHSFTHAQIIHHYRRITSGPIPAHAEMLRGTPCCERMNDKLSSVPPVSARRTCAVRCNSMHTHARGPCPTQTAQWGPCFLHSRHQLLSSNSSACCFSFAVSASHAHRSTILEHFAWLEGSNPQSAFDLPVLGHSGPLEPALHNLS